MAEGDVIPVDGVGNLKVMETPGHSPGSIALYLKEEQLMCLSDAGGYQIRSDFIFPIYFQGYEMYLESLNRMSTYPTQVLFLPMVKYGLEIRYIFSTAGPEKLLKRPLTALGASWTKD